MRARSLFGLTGGLVALTTWLAFSSAQSQERLPCYQLPSDLAPAVAISLLSGASSTLSFDLLEYNPRAQPGDLVYVPRNAAYLELCPEQHRPFVQFWYGLDPVPAVVRKPYNNL